MRLTSAVTALVVLLAPAATVAQITDDWGTSTSSIPVTTTITKTLVYANATVTMHYSSKPTGWNATSYATNSAATAIGTTSLFVSQTSAAAAAASTCKDCLVNGASIDHANLAVAAVVGAAALIWGSL